MEPRTLRVMYITAAFFIVSEIIYHFYKKKNKTQKEPQEIHEVIMFSQNGTVLKKSKYSRCLVTQSMERVITYLNAPRFSLDICMYLLTSPDLANTIIKVYRSGVAVRMVVDADMAYASGSHVRKLEKIGVPVRWLKSTNLMHHKFCLIDASVEDPSITAAVMVGSLNWTTAALSGNWEDVIVTSQPVLVSEFKREFERLWAEFKSPLEFDNKFLEGSKSSINGITSARS